MSSDEVVPDVPVGVDGVVEAVWGVAGVVEDLGEGEVSGGGFAEEVAESGEGGVSAGGAFCGLFGEAEVCVCLLGPDLFVDLGSADPGVWVGGDEGCEFGEVRSSADVGSFVECCHAWGPEDVDPDVFVDGECVVWCRRDRHRDGWRVFCGVWCVVDR